MSILGRLSFKDQAFKLREDAILDAATRTLASKGFDLMTMDDVALEVGISKPSLYKHFKSKEDLAGAAMVRLLDGAQDFLDARPQNEPPLAQLSAALKNGAARSFTAIRSCCNDGQRFWLLFRQPKIVEQNIGTFF